LTDFLTLLVRRYREKWIDCVMCIQCAYS